MQKMRKRSWSLGQQETTMQVQGAEEMSLCSDCNQPLTHNPMEKHAPGGDWFYACNICEWHSEDERPHTTIRKSLSPEEIVHIKIKVNAIRHYLRFMADDRALTKALELLSASLIQTEEKI